MKKIFNILILIFCINVVASANYIDMKNVKVKYYKNNIQLIFSFNKPVDYHAFTLAKPYRIVFDFKNTILKANIKSLTFKNQTIKTIRAGQYGSYLRVVIDVAFLMKYKYSVVNKPRNYQIIISLINEDNSITNQMLSVEDTDASYLPQNRLVKIVIDPGHGGKDPGAIGYRGIQEKTIVLQIAKKLQYMINSSHNMRATLTRERDCYVPLRQRIVKARKTESDLFISIHADAFKNRGYSGCSIYALSTKGASSEAARWLAEKENYSELGGVDLSNKDKMLKSFLLDLSQTATIGASLKLGEYMLRELNKTTKLLLPRVEQAPFVVLKSPDIPSLLVEVGCLTNKREELRLKHDGFQQKIAKAIIKGIIVYLREYPLDAVADPEVGIYIVKKDDTLDRIAKRFHIKVDDLKKMNKLKTKHVVTGQKLEIPQ